MAEVINDDFIYSFVDLKKSFEVKKKIKPYKEKNPRYPELICRCGKTILRTNRIRHEKSLPHKEYERMMKKFSFSLDM